SSLPCSDTIQAKERSRGGADTTMSSATQVPTADGFEQGRRIWATETWAPVSIDKHRMIVYGPRFGRTYLVERRHLEDPGFFRAIGLRDPPAVEPLGDPAERIAHTLSDLETIEMNLPPALFRAAYRWLKFSRHFVPLRA